MRDREDIFERARRDGRRRLSMPPLTHVAASLAAGTAILVGVVAHDVLSPRWPRRG